MTDDKPMKSSFELAMERLRKNDADAGIESRPLTDAQKAAIAEVRNFYEAKIAEQQVLHQSRLKTTADPAERATLEEGYRRDRERFASERDAKIEKIRNPRHRSAPASLMDDTFLVTCPYCGEVVEIYVEPEVRGSFVQDCEVCCNPWRVRVWREDGERQVEIGRADGSE